MARRWILAAACAAGCLLAPPAQASLTPTPEPAFTAGSANTWQVGYAAAGVTGYGLRWTLRTAGVAVASEFAECVAGCDSIGGSYLPASASGTAQRSFTGLASGVAYDVCVEELTRPDPGAAYTASSPTCFNGSIQDGSAPTIGNVTLANGSAATALGTMSVSVTYADAISPPWPALWLRASGALAGGAAFATGWMPVTCELAGLGAVAPFSGVFTCTLDTANVLGTGFAAADGQVAVDARVADGARPGDPAAAALPDGANLFSYTGASILLDRVAPTIAPVAVQDASTGPLLATFSADGTDTGSGLANEGWRWQLGPACLDPATGQPHPTAVGGVVQCRFAVPGTYTVSLSGRDAAGNEAAGAVAVRVVEVAEHLVELRSDERLKRLGRPVIVGRPAVGNTLGCGTGRWTAPGLIRFAYVWKRGLKQVARGGRYKLRTADRGHRMTCTVTARSGATAQRVTTARTAKVR